MSHPRELRLDGIPGSSLSTTNPKQHPDDESLTAMMLELTAEGNIRTSTLRAFDHDQMQAIIRRTG
jgi:uncharacterized protein with GYD domain